MAAAMAMFGIKDNSALLQLEDYPSGGICDDSDDDENESSEVKKHQGLQGFSNMQEVDDESCATIFGYAQLGEGMEGIPGMDDEEDTTEE